MSSDIDVVIHVTEQSGLGPALSHRKMFGEFALYLDGRVVALVCDNTLFVKPTTAGRALLGEVSEHPAYPGGKPWFRVDEVLDDRDLLQRLFIATARELPLPKPKNKPKPKPAARKGP